MGSRASGDGSRRSVAVAWVREPHGGLAVDVDPRRGHHLPGHHLQARPDAGGRVHLGERLQGDGLRLAAVRWPWSEFIVKWPAWTANNWTIPLVSVAAYFALMSTQYRKYITPYAILITLAQLAQMLVGMFVTIKAVMYQDEGLECHVNKTNSILGLAMYFSYFLLFFKLFIENYVTQTRKAPAKGPRSLSRKITNQMMPQVEDEGEDDGGHQQKGQYKKIN